MSINIFDLSRDIPEEIKRKIRRKSFFGCIFCGSLITDYEHILPEFKDCKEHDPEKICLVCPNHHRKITQGRISKKQVLAQYNNPSGKKTVL